jgi:type I restriction enzyme S subunit
MSYIEKLLAGTEVEWKTLGEISIQINGMSGVSNKWAEKGNCRFIDYLNAYKHIKIDINQLPFATVKNLNQTELKQGDILFTSASETPDECAISSVIEDKIDSGVFLDDHLFGIRISGPYKNIID